MKYKYEKAIYVNCTFCKDRYDEKEVKFIDIEEDIQGRDIMTFECPVCKNEVRSLRFG